MNYILHLFTRFNDKSLYMALLYLVLLILAWLWVAGNKTSWRKLLIAFVLFLTFRFVFFGNPLIWTIYSKLTDYDTIDQRLGMLIGYNIQKNQNIPDKVHYLAMGTSQTNALYGGYVKDHDFIIKNTIAGILPNEYFLCNEYISNSPDTLLLYLSEFDFCRVPNYTSLYVLPEQYWGWFTKVKILQEGLPGNKFESNPFKLMMNDFFPEFKYRLMFRHIVLNLLHLDKNEPQSLDVGLKSHLEGLKLLKDDGLIQYHIGAFEHFIIEATAKGKTVIICEGMYNPLALSEKNTALRQKVREKLVELAWQYPGVIYIPLQDQYRLSVTDYADGYHVSRESGYRWADYLFKFSIPGIKAR